MTSISGGISFAGLGTGDLDFNAILEQQRSIKEIPKKRLEAWQSDWQLRYDAFDSLLTSVQTLSDKLSALGSVETFLKKTTLSSDESVATATAGSSAINGTNSIDVKQLATNAVLTNNHVFSSKHDVVTGAAQSAVFSYDYKGKTYSLQIPENCELEYLVTKINGDQNNPGVTASLLKTGNGYVFQLQGDDTGAGADLRINSATNLPAFSASSTATASVANLGDIIAATATQFYITSGGKSFAVDLGANATAQNLIDLINSNTATTGLTARAVSTGSGYDIELQSLYGGATVTGTDGLSNITWSSSGGGSYAYTQSAALGANSATVINTSGTERTYSFTDKDGTNQQISLKRNGTLQDLVNEINKTTSASGVTASLVDDGSGTDTTKLQLSYKDENGVEHFVDLRDDANSTPVTFTGTAATEVINPTGTSTFFSYRDINGNQVDIEVKAGDTLQNLVTKINAERGTSGVKASLITVDGQQRLQLERSDGQPVTIVANSTELGGLAPDGWTSTVAVQGSGWNKREAQDAIFTVNDLNMEFTSDSNLLTEVFPGLDVTLLSTGKTQITTATSTEETKEKVEEFVEAYNELIAAFQEVTKYDEDKTVKSRGVSTDEDGNYTIDFSSQFSYQKGGVLTGNYGVQTLVSEIKQLVSGTAGGFRSKENDDDLSGDLFTSLSSIGIIVDTDESSSTFGQLKLMTEDERIEKGGANDDSNPYRTLDMALEEDPEAVVNLLVGSGGVTDSNKFSYMGAGVTSPTPGTYTVEYTIDTAGTAPDYITVDGIQVPRDGQTGTYVVPSGSLAGVEIAVDDLSAGTVSSSIRIKQGKIAQLSAKLKQELRDDPILDGYVGQRGSLVILKDNYRNIMENIQEKIDKETTRIQTWYERQRLRYARLDTLLGQYSNQMSANSAALSTASTNNSSS